MSASAPHRTAPLATRRAGSRPVAGAGQHLASSRGTGPPTVHGQRDHLAPASGARPSPQRAGPLQAQWRRLRRRPAPRRPLRCPTECRASRSVPCDKTRGRCGRTRQTLARRSTGRRASSWSCSRASRACETRSCRRSCPGQPSSPPWSRSCVVGTSERGRWPGRSEVSFVSSTPRQRRRGVVPTLRLSDSPR